jgi:hypothetical protein
MTDLGGVGQGAYCALHPDQQATRTCTRCGNFMCTTCSQSGEQPHCPTCRERTGEDQPFPLTRDSWNFNKLWDYSFAAFKQNWLMISAAILIVGGIGFFTNLLTRLLPLIGNAMDNQVVTIVLTIVAAFVQNVVQGLLGVGMSRLMIDVLQGKPAAIERVFSQFDKAGTYISIMLIIVAVAAIPAGVLTGIVIGLMSAFPDAGPAIAIVVGGLALIPLIYFFFPLIFIQPEMAIREGSPKPMQLLRNCFAYARGQRLSIFGVLMIETLLVLGGVLACCIGVIPAAGLASLLTTGLYLALSNGAEVER